MKMKIKPFLFGTLMCGVLAAGIASVPALLQSGRTDSGSVLSNTAAAVFHGPSVSGRKIELSENVGNGLQAEASRPERLAVENRIGCIESAALIPSENIPHVAFSKEKNVPVSFTEISMENYTYTEEVGHPKLPIKMELIEIPFGATVKINYRKVEYRDLDLSLQGLDAPIVPAQIPARKSAREMPPFSFDKDAYARNEYVVDIDGNTFAGQDGLVTVLETGIMRDTRMGKLVISPFRYNAVTNTLRIYTVVDAEIEFENADMAQTYDKKARYYSPYFASMRKHLLNPISLPASSAKATAYNAPISYVIVSDPMFKDSLQEFIRWKTRFGFKVTEAYTDQAEVGKTSTSIRSYLKGLYDNATEDAPAPTFVLFVGDQEQIPTQFYEGLGWPDEGHYSDLFLCDYTDDHRPDVYYGRMSATNVEELMPQIKKVMYMESLRPENASFLDTSVVIAGYDASFGGSHLNPTVNYIHSLYMPDTLSRYGYQYLYPDSRNQAKAIVQNVQDGAGVVIYTAHGSEYGWYEPKFEISDVRTLTNKGKYPLMIGNCCLTGKFDEPECFGESLLRAEDAGAAVYIGATNSTYFDEDVWWAIGYTNIFSEGVVHTYASTGFGAYDAYYHTHNEEYAKWAVSVYDLVRIGNVEVDRVSNDMDDYYWEVYHVFGDPSYMPYNQKPENLSVAHNNEVVKGEAFFSVSTEPYARVVISYGKTVLAVATADAQGSAMMALGDLRDYQTLDLTVSAQNRYLYTFELRVVDPGAKYVTVSARNYFNGNGDPVTEMFYGETYDAKFVLTNYGSDPVQKIRMRLRSDSPYLSIADSVFVIEKTLDPDEDLEADHAFKFVVDPDVPDNSWLDYSVIICLDDETDSIVQENKVKARAMDIRVTGFDILDADGNLSSIDPGQTATGKIYLQNAGMIPASAVSVSLTSACPYLTLPEEDIQVGDMAVGDLDTLTFSFSAEAASSLYYEKYEIEVGIKTMGRVQRDTVDSYIGSFVESFETGNFLAVDWDPATEWVIDNTFVHSGEYSASSPDGVQDKQTVTLRLPVNVPQKDRISFYYAVSTENANQVLGDFLEFYIDGTRKGRWGGLSKTWTYVQYEIPAGEHVFEWKYVKDADAFDGEDKVWIDDIRLPIGTWINPDPSDTATANQTAGEWRPSVEVAVQGGQLSVDFGSDREVTGSLYIVNTLGQRVMMLENKARIAAGANKTYQLAGLAKGLYILVFETDQRRDAVKFVLSR